MNLQLKSVSVPASAGKRLSTPTFLYAMLMVVISLATVWTIGIYMSVSSSRNALDTVAMRAVPSIIAAKEIRARLLEMDASAATEFLGEGAAGRAREQYEAARATVSQLLVNASNQKGASAEQQAGLSTVLTKLQQYNGTIETARANARQGFPVGAAWMRSSGNLLRTEILPAVDQLDKINQAYLDSQYAAHRKGVTFNLMVGVASGIALLGALLYTQIFLSGRMRRTINPLLAAASVLVVVVTGLFGISLKSSDNNLRLATEQAFTSVQSVWQARAVAYDAKADQGLYLIQRGGGKKYEDSFDVKAKSLIDNIQQSNRVEQLTSEPARKDMVTAYQGFVDMQGQLKQLDKGGERTRAVQMAVSNGAGSANAVFAKLDSAFESVLKTDKGLFDQSVASAKASLSLLDLICMAAAFITVLLTWAGLRPRINEYRV